MKNGFKQYNLSDDRKDANVCLHISEVMTILVALDDRLEKMINFEAPVADVAMAILLVEELHIIAKKMDGVNLDKVPDESRILELKDWVVSKVKESGDNCNAYI